MYSYEELIEQSEKFKETANLPQHDAFTTIKLKYENLSWRVVDKATGYHNDPEGIALTCSVYEQPAEAICNLEATMWSHFEGIPVMEDIYLIGNRLGKTIRWGLDKEAMNLKELVIDPITRLLGG